MSFYHVILPYGSVEDVWVGIVCSELKSCCFEWSKDSIVFCVCVSCGLSIVLYDDGVPSMMPHTHKKAQRRRQANEVNCFLWAFNA